MTTTKRVAIAGFGREGRAILRFLKRMPKYRHAEIWILDKNPNLKLPRGMHGQLGEKYLVNLEKFDVIFRSPGIPYESTEFRRARAKGVKFSSATKLFFEGIGKMVRYGSPQVIGITGTKGKSTTSTLLYNILRAAGKPAYLAGNIGTPAINILQKLSQRSRFKRGSPKAAIVILELSSFQLQDLGQSPHMAIVLSIFPDHQNAHKNLREYYSAKSNIARFQKKNDVIFFFPQNVVSRKIAGLSRGKHIPVDGKNFTIFSPDDLKLKGAHTFMNAAMAATVAETLGVPREIIRKAVCTFRGLPHRLEFVRAIKTKDRTIEFWNDSASSNPGAADAAVQAFHGEDFILIAGGKDKNLDYRPLARALKHSPARTIVLYGENKQKIARALKPTSIKIHIVKNVSAAVGAALRAAKRMTLSREEKSAAIVFSPGSASFDQFKNFDERGDTFKKIVHSLK